MNRAQTGQRGEAVAAKFYLDRGCRLLTHNSVSYTHLTLPTN